tara:strand:- start:327 stop:1607 length:1281 start_codon:yes stop_codon:yes gene_type:complete
LILSKDFLGKISAVFITDLIAKSLAFIILPIYLYLMPKEEFGEFGFLFTVSITSSTLLSLSFYSLLIKDLSKQENIDLHKEFFSSLFIFAIIFNFILFIMLALMESYFNLFSDFFSLDAYKFEKIILVGIIIILNIISLFQYSLLLIRKKTIDICLFIFLKFLFSNLISIFSLYYFDTDSVLIRLYSLAISEFILILFIFFLLKENYLINKINTFYLLKSIKIAAPLILATFLSLIMITIDRKLIQYHYGNNDLADYNLAYLLLLPVAMIISSVQSIWSPRLFELKDAYIARNETIKAMFILFIFLIFLCFVIFIFVNLLFKLNLISNEYSNVLLLFMTLSIGTIFGSLTNFIDNLNLYIDRTYYKLITTLFIVSLFSILNVYLVPLYSYYGVSISLFVANFMGLILGYVLVTIKIKYVKNKNIRS